MSALARWNIPALLLLATASASSGEFYLFPIKEIEGMGAVASPNLRKLVDPAVTSKYLDSSVQTGLLGHFVAELARQYPQSVIHPKQVNDTRVGSGYRFVDNDVAPCKQAPSFNVHETYAVSLGVTRAVVHESIKGENVELLIFTTVNLQFIRPSLAKVVYTISDTIYSPFRFTRSEYASGAADARIREILFKNVSTQVSSLVASAKSAFNPKDVSAKVVDKDGSFLVLDRGADVGVPNASQIEARSAQGAEIVLDVVNVDSDYSVVRAVGGKVAVGDTISLVIDQVADDARKPRILPVTSRGSAGGSDADVLIDYFSKNVGFKASFQLTPVDVNFAQTRISMTQSANCVSWDKLNSMTEVEGERKNPPDFFIRFEAASSPISVASGAGDFLTAEKLHTVVGAQIVDSLGRVIFSELGDDDYTLTKVGNTGLNSLAASEISFKNAMDKLSSRVLAQVKFEPKDFVIAKVDGGRLWVQGLPPGLALTGAKFDVLRPLSAKVRGRTPLLDLDVSERNDEVVADGGLYGLPYSATRADRPKPARGDLLRMKSPLQPASTKLVDCGEPPYVGSNNAVEVAHAGPVIRHFLAKSTRYATYVGGTNFYESANALLQQGFFAERVQAPSADQCVQPGYVIREEAVQCADARSCKATMGIAIVARFKQGGAVLKSLSSGQRAEFTGVPGGAKTQFYGYKSLASFLSMQSDFVSKLNSN